MKRLLLAITLAFAAGCTSSTDLGECIGAFDDGDPNLVYKHNTTNIVLAVIFVETIVVPLIVVLEETKCPVATKVSK